MDDDIEALCPACVEGDHNDCEGDYCMCIDMEHDGGQFGEDGSIASEQERPGTTFGRAEV